MLAWLSAGDGGTASTLILIAASFLTSLMTAALGLGGGVTLLAVMAQLLPASAIVPLHGVVQLGSNLGRSALLLRAVDWLRLGPFVIGACFGAAIGGSIAISLPAGALQIALGVFILVTLWGPALPRWVTGRAGLALSGGLSSLLTMFVGATGPFVSASFKPLNLPPQIHVATFSAAMTFQHGVKIAAFGLLGFGFGPYLGLMGAMITSGFVGTWIGTKILKRRKAESFQRWLSIILTVLAVRLIYLGLSA